MDFFFHIVPLQTNLSFILILGSLSCEVNVSIDVWITHVASSSITESETSESYIKDKSV